MTSTGILESTTVDAPFGTRQGVLQAETATPGADTRVLDYVARAPLTYPVPFNLLPPKWPKRK